MHVSTLWSDALRNNHSKHEATLKMALYILALFKMKRRICFSSFHHFFRQDDHVMIHASAESIAADAKTCLKNQLLIS